MLGIDAAASAAHATFIEKDRAALAALRQNVERLGEVARSDIRAGDATRPPRAMRPAGIAFLDPPYGEGLAATALTALAQAGWLVSGSVAMVECAATDAFEAPPGFRVLDERRYGKAAVRFLVRE